MDSSNKEELNKYPRFIEDRPEGRDDYESKSQIKIANNIIQFLNENEHSKRRVIGIEGEWGSGKSNVIEILKKQLLEKYYFYIFDAWGHQEDLTRRSILEGLLVKLIKDEQLVGDKKKWLKELSTLLSKKVEREHKDIPKLSWGLILSFIGILLMPVTRFIAETYLKTCSVAPSSTTPASFPSFLNYTVSASILISPFIFLLAWMLWKICRAEKGNKIKVFSELFYVYRGKEITNTSEETISENEPSVRQFTEFLFKLERNCPKKKIVIVFDNMDRLPSTKVIEIWSSIHTFFANDDSELKTWAMVPFDDAHICNIFKDGYNNCPDNESKQRADSYIHKTFTIVFHVAPPVLSDWKYVFSSKFKEAFGYQPPYEQNIETIFDFHYNTSPKIKPRDIICFINDLVALKKLWNDEIPLKYLAIFALKRKEILINPFEKILKHEEFLGATSVLFKNDNNLEPYLSALAFNAPVEKATEFLLKRTIEKTLTGEGDFLLVSTSKSFFTIFDSVFYRIKPNIIYSIARLDELPEEIKNKPEMDNYWYGLSNSIIEIEKPDKSHINAIKVLVKRLKDKSAIERILKFLFLKAKTDNDQNQKLYAGAKYYKLVTEIENLLTEIGNDKNVTEFLFENRVEAEEYFEFVKAAGVNYDQYKVFCDKETVNGFLTTKFSDNTIPVIFNELKHIIGKTDLTLFEANINSIIPTLTAVTPNLNVILKNIFDTGKILSNNNQLVFDIPEINATTFLNALPSCDSSIDLLLCIIKSNNNKPNPAHVKNPNFIKILADTQNLEAFLLNYKYYLTYSDLVNYQLQFPNSLVKAIINKITAEIDQVLGKDVEKLISKYIEIKTTVFDSNTSLINAFISRLSSFYDSRNDIFVFNEIFLTQIIPLIQDNHNVKSNLINDLIKQSNTYLTNLEKSAWYDALKLWDTSKIVELFTVLISINKYTSAKLAPNTNSAYLDILISISKKEIAIPKNMVFWNILYKMHIGNLSLTFQTIRDELMKPTIHGNISMDELLYFESGLFQFGKLNQNQAIADEVLRLILIPLASQDDNYINILKRNSKYIKDIVSSAKDMIIEFKNALDSNIPSIFESQDCKAFTKILIDKNNELIEELHANRLIISKARYGKNGVFNDVEKIISELLINNSSFSVENITLGGDPIRNTVKELQIDYKLKKLSKTLIANEDEIVELHDDELTTKPTDLSLLKQSYNVNQEKLADIIRGDWYLKKSVGGEDLREKIRIDKKGGFYIDNKHKFNLLVTELNTTNIVLNKVNLNYDIEITEQLTINSDVLISGSDSQGTILEYIKK